MSWVSTRERTPRNRPSITGRTALRPPRSEKGFFFGGDKPRWILAPALAAALALATLTPSPFPEVLAYSSEGTVVVELSGVSKTTVHDGSMVSGTDYKTRQPYKFCQERWGEDFVYLFSGLKRNSYDVELSFFEPVYGPGERIFTVYANGSPLPGLTDLDIASRVGRNTAYQMTVRNVPAPGGRMELRFTAKSREATVCHIRLLSSGATALEIDVKEDRHWQSLPTRFVNREGQDVHEVVLGRLGSRFMINPQPQFLAWRYSPLGTWADDLGELVLAFKDAEGDIRCLPFTPRYPIFTQISQSDGFTAVTYSCSDPSLPFRAEITFRAPFYPRDILLSTSPFFYIDIKVVNDSPQTVPGSFLLALPHKEDLSGSAAPTPLSSAPGYLFRTRYTFGAESYVRAGNNSGFVLFEEALSLSEDSGVSWYFQNPNNTAWIWPSPSGYPLPYPHSIYTFVPRGHTGFEWGFLLAPGESLTKSAVLAAHSSSPVLNVKGDKSYRFIYSSPLGADLSSVEEVVAYAHGERGSILEKTEFFEDVFSRNNLSPLSDTSRNLLALAFQNLLINTWWCYNAQDQEWFSVWEGVPCMFHSTIDVEYNNAWFYLLLWPDLLGRLLREWPLFEKSSPQGKYLSHDMGVVNQVTGMAYPHDMPVEENADFILLLYVHWRYSGDKSILDELLPKAAEYLRFILNCDTDGNGFPDLHTSNTIDQGSEAIQHSRNQTYLGVKVLASCKAFSYMADALNGYGDLTRSAGETVIRANLTLERMWLGDHFAICDDPSIPKEEAEAYSLYTSNGLLYLLTSGLDTGLTAENLERMGKDIVSGASRLTRRYGDVHTSVNNENQWVSQNLWRDALGYYLDLPRWASDQDARIARYWNLQLLYATRQRGGFWDVCDYRDHHYMGASEAFARGFASAEQANDYLQIANGSGEGFSGTFRLMEPYRQSLGYYPRGATAFVLLPALARLRLDRPGDLLLYAPAHAPARIPVLTCADWEAPDPTARIPVLEFDSHGNLARVKNPNLLPSQLRRPEHHPVIAPEARPFSCRPGDETQIKVSYQAPPGAVKRACVLSSSGIKRWVTPGQYGLSWDGRDERANPVPDGDYYVFIEADSPEPWKSTPSVLIPVGVNTNLPNPSTTWYLAEGYTGSNPTGGDFETWLLLQNPSGSAAEVGVTFMQPGGSNTRRTYTVSPRSRFTVSVDQIFPASEVSILVESNVPLVAERAMYWNERRAGHATIGVDSPSTSWYLAEGYTGGDFDEWILIQNPGDLPADVRVQFLTGGQGTREGVYRLGPRSRFTVHVDDLLPNSEVSALITSDRPVVVERAQYLNHMRGGTCSLGARSPSTSWFFAEGYTDQGFEEWILIQNPNPGETRVRVSFAKRDGTVSSFTYRVAGRARFTIPVHRLLPGQELSAQVLSDLPVVAERAMYWGGRSDGHASLGTPAPEYVWCLAEGYTDQGFETWILLLNPNPAQARVRFTFMLPEGRQVEREYSVAPRSRFTLNAYEVLGKTEFSTRIASNLPLVAERAMYWNGRSGGHCSIGVIER